jgi:nucleoid DNA-binding protein
MRQQIKVTKESLIKDISKQTNQNVSDVKDIYNTFENIIFDTLSSVDEEHDVCIKMFEGISLDGKFTPEKTKKNNLTGQVSVVESKIKPKFNITRYYCEKLNKK